MASIQDPIDDDEEGPDDLGRDHVDDDSEGDGDPVHDPGPDTVSDSIDSYAEGLGDSDVLF